MRILSRFPHRFQDKFSLRLKTSLFWHPFRDKILLQPKTSLFQGLSQDIFLLLQKISSFKHSYKEKCPFSTKPAHEKYPFSRPKSRRSNFQAQNHPKSRAAVLRHNRQQKKGCPKRNILSCTYSFLQLFVSYS